MASDENFPGVIRASNVHGGLNPGGGGKPTAGARQTRRALRTINPNIIAPPPYPRAVHKRGALEGYEFCKPDQKAGGTRNPAPRRPVTRMFAAQMTGNQQQKSNEEVKRSVQAVSSGWLSEDCLITDAEDYEATNDFNMPMFVKHTEAMLQEIDRMDAEVEMEDIDTEDPVVDIDIGDKNNPFAVVEYIDDIYAQYKNKENLSCVPPDYMAQQFDINERMRAILIDWLIEVHYKFELLDETLYLTINLIDRFLAVQPVMRKKLQLVGVTAMLVACKYEEVSVPVVEDFVLISDKAYCRKEVLDMEKLMVNTLQFNLSVPTPYVFMRRFLKAAESDKKLDLLSFFMIELSLVEYKMLKFPPSLLAAAAIFTAQCTLGGSKKWSKTSEKYTNYSEYQLLDCAKLMVSFHQKAGTGKLTGVHKKYSTHKYGYAAKSQPALFLLDEDHSKDFMH